MYPRKLLEVDPSGKATGFVYGSVATRQLVVGKPGDNVAYIVPRKAVFYNSEGWPAIDRALDRWSDLQDDWDGDDAIAPLDVQIEAARAFVREAEASGIREPRPYIAPDGEIGFHFDGPDKASVSFLGTDRFLAFCPRPGARPVSIAGPLELSTASVQLFDALSGAYPR